MSLSISLCIALLSILGGYANGAVNLALNKPAQQGSTYPDSSGKHYGAQNAVDGNNRTLSHTKADTGKWWKVNLQAKYSIGTIKLYNRDGYYERLAKISILTSNSPQPNTPSLLTSNDWTRVSYQGPAYGAVGTHSFNPSIEGQHVAVFSENEKALALTEVEIYEYNYALNGTAEQRSNYSNLYLEGNAIDGNKGSVSITKFVADEGYQWWKVELSRQIILRKATIYVRVGNCNGVSSCDFRLTDVYFLTNKDATVIEPNKEGNGSWNLCYYSESAMGPQYDITCNNAQPLIKQFSIVTYEGISVELREVEIYGHELPQLGADIDGKVDFSNSSSLTVSFIKWNQPIVGGPPPTSYSVQLVEINQTQTVNHPLQTDIPRIRTTWQELQIDHMYTFHVTCSIQGKPCNGGVQVFTATTLCEAPEEPANLVMSYSNATTEVKSISVWKYTFSWQSPNNSYCRGEVSYIYNISGYENRETNTTTAEFTLDGHQSFLFALQSKNSAGMLSLKVSSNGTSAQIAPQFVSNPLSLVGNSSDCVALTWTEPEYPGGPITSYQYRCDNRSFTSTNNTSAVSCGHGPNTAVRCVVRARNGAGSSKPKARHGTTRCAVPSVPLEVHINQTEKTHDERQMIKFTVTWQVPEEANCNDTIEYVFDINGRIAPQPQHTTNTTFYLDGNQAYNFTVRAQNSIGQSVPANSSGRANSLAPQFGDSHYTATAINSTCIDVIWSYPQYPGGTITSYEVKCADRQWESVDPEPTNMTSCGHEPFTTVQCHLSAVNSAGNSSILNITGRTNCDVPDAPHNLSFTSVKATNDSRQRWLHTATWQPPEKSNCNDTLMHVYELNGTSSSPQENTTAEFYLDGDQPFTFVVKAKNSVGLSEPLEADNTSDILAPHFGDSQYTATAISSTCIDVIWSYPQYPGGTITSYEVKCGGKEWKSVNSSLTNITSCGHPPYATVQCLLMAVNPAGNSSTLSATDRTLCDVPDAPNSLRLTSAQAMNDSRQRWLYTATWQAPVRTNCNDTLMYVYNLNGNSSSPQEYNTTEFYLDGNQSFTFKVRAKNSVGPSKRVKEENTSGILAPQFGDRQYKTTAINSTCIDVIWSYPQYPGGTITSYEVKCADREWKFVDPRLTIRTSCGHQPYTTVQCQLIAVNLAGNSSILSATDRTLCDVPDAPHSINFSSVKARNDSRQRWHYTVTWQAPNGTNCNGTLMYTYELNGTSFSPQENTTAEFYVDGYQSFTFVVRANNSVGPSEPVRAENMSGILAPQFGDSKFLLQAINSSCVLLSWESPQFPGGPLDDYQYKCNNDSWQSVEGLVHTRCGYRPYTEVICSLVAVNIDGHSTNLSQTVRTNCTTPGTPQNLALTALNVTESGRVRWRYLATWQAPPINCNGSLWYRWGNNGTVNSANNTSNSTTFHLDGYQKYNFIVQAFTHFEASATQNISNRSDQLAPQFKPRSVSLESTSSSCVNLSWQPPEFVGGPINGYQINCTKASKTSVNTSRSQQLCSYQPYELVQCKIWAENDAGVSQIEEKEIRTDCARPVFTQEIRFNESYDPDKKRRQIAVLVDEEDIDENCDRLNSLEYKIDGQEFSTSNEMKQLDALTNYTILVLATNNEGLFTVENITVLTGELEPSTAPNITRNFSKLKECVVVEWEEPSQPNGVIKEYQYRSKLKSESYGNWTSIQLQQSFTECGFDAGDVVYCQVKAGTAIGFGPASEVIIPVTCDNASAPSFNLTSFEGNDKKAKILIDLEESKSYCLSLKPYIIIVLRKDNSVYEQKTTTSAGNHSIVGLDPFTFYWVSIEASNNENRSSKTVQNITTVETYLPEEPQSLEMHLNASCISLAVTKPKRPNGVIHQYRFACYFNNSKGENQTQEENKTDIYNTFCHFPSATPVTCSAAAINSVGIGQSAVKVNSTKLKTIGDPSTYKPQENTNTKTKGKDMTVPITIKPIPVENVNLSFYRVMLQQTSEERIEKRDTSNSARENCSELTINNTYTSPGQCYTTGEINAKLVTNQTNYVFNVGDEKSDTGFHNRQLSPGASYSLYIAGVASMQEGQGYLVIVTEPIGITGPSPKKGVAVGTIVGAVVGVIVVAVAVLAVLFVYRKKNKVASPESHELTFQHKKDASDGFNSQPTSDIRPKLELAIKPKISAKPKPLPPRPNEPPFRLPDFNQQPSRRPMENIEENAYGNAGPVHAQSEPIPVEKLEWYNKTNVEAIKKQYEDLKALPKPAMDIALLPENKGKCRYKGIYPGNKNRVTLQRNGESDFVNASYLKGYSRDKQYIAAQGPFTEPVVNDFWCMIWQERPSAIVMVTRAIENAKMKCLQYWPLTIGNTSTFGEFKVTLKSSEMYSDFAVNKLEVSKNGETRYIPHYNYLSWPDHGVPDIEVFVSFHRMISAAIVRLRNQPLLIHCSAGVGRTGTYIALDYLLEQAKAEGVVDMFDCVKNMRARRPCMIQTVEQYVLLHQALYESFSTTSFSCSPLDIDSKINSHIKDNGTTTDIILAEYLHAAYRIRSLNLSYASGKDPENQDKNRFSEILPCESYMLYLSNGIRGNYINAVTIDGYKEKKQWIATQLPLSNTIVDFWQLIFEQDIKIIVQLEGAQKPFYPLKDNKEMTVEKCCVKRLTSTDSETAKCIDIQLQIDEDERSVQVLVLKNWITETLPTTDAIISLHEAADRLQQQTSTRRMCVTCLDGSSRCGLFICAYNAIEKLKAEQIVDLYYPIVMAKQRRPQFIPTIEQYRCLYQVLKDYMSAFGEYANFG